MSTFCLEVINGRFAGSTMLLQPGDVCRIGSRAGSELWLADDRQVEPVHCAVAADRRVVRLHDLSQAGTFVNGRRVTRSVLRHGDWIATGTSLTFFFEQGESEEGFETVTGNLTQFLRTWKEPYWFIGECPEGSFEKFLLQGIGEDCNSTHTPGLSIARVPQGWAGQQWLLRAVWGKGRGFFFQTTGAPVSDVVHHFAALGEQRPGTTRYFDPRVLRALLPEMSAEQVRELMGPAANSFLLESQLPHSALVFGWRQQKLAAELIRLSRVRPPLPTQTEISKLLSGGETPESVFAGLTARMSVERADFNTAQQGSRQFSLSTPEARVQFALLDAVLRDAFRVPEVDTLLESFADGPDSALDRYVAEVNTRRG